MAMPFEHLRDPEDPGEELAGASVEQTNPNADGSVEAAQEKQAGAQGNFVEPIDQIRECGADRLADYLENLSEEQRVKIHRALVARGEAGISAFCWVEATHQDEARELLNNILLAQDGAGISNAVKACAEALTKWNWRDDMNEA